MVFPASNGILLPLSYVISVFISNMLFRYVHPVDTSLYVRHSIDLCEKARFLLNPVICQHYLCTLTPSNNLTVNFPVTTSNVTFMHSFRSHGILTRHVSVNFPASYLFTRINKFIVYIRAKCSKVFTYTNTAIVDIMHSIYI